MQPTDRIVSRCFSADTLTPILAFSAIRSHYPEALLLESLDDSAHTGRYSHIGFDPLAEFKVQEASSPNSENSPETLSSNPLLARARAAYQRYRCTPDDPRVMIVGGMTGYLHYEATQYFEKIPTHATPNNNPRLHLIAFKQGITFDHRQQEIIVSLRVADNISEHSIDAQVHTLLTRIQNATPLPHATLATDGHYPLPETLHTSMNDAAFAESVEKIKQHIIDGDIFQMVLSRRFETPFKGDPLTVYRALRHLNPSPYMFYLPCGDSIMVGASPEKCVSLHQGVLEVNPLAGTRARGNGIDDNAIADELAHDEKEVAEHMMLVDLARNDCGKIAVTNSVSVKACLSIKKARHVMHLSSQVNAHIRDEYDAFDALAATLPAGTLSGAPKVRAMELIHAFEPQARQLYGGAVVMFDGNGNLESCIAIRMAQIQNGLASVQTGAGIVFDSNPHAEALETRAKAKSVLTAIAKANEVCHDTVN